MNWMLMALFLYFVGALTMLLPKSSKMAAHYLGMGLSTVASAIVGCLAFWYLLFPTNDWLVNTGWGVYTLQADPWGAAFLFITGLAGTIISLYGIDYAKGYSCNRIRALTGLWNLFLLSMVVVLLAGDAFTFLLAWEIMAVVSFLLVNHEAELKTTWNAAYQYLVMTHIGTGAIMIAFYLVGSGSESMAFADLNRTTITGYVRDAAFISAFLGFALKSGLVPLHVWLPNAHPAAPSHVSALMSGVMLKVALYGFGRFIFQFLDCNTLWYGVVVMVIGLLSAFLGVLYATMSRDIKRILAYSSVENMGIIFSALGAGMVLVAQGHSGVSMVCFVAALVHAFNHSIMKSLLFMSAGAVMHATGSKRIEHMGGLAKKMPWTAGFTLVGSMALSTLPLTNGFVGEWLTLQGFITLADKAGNQGIKVLVIFAFIMLGLTGALALGCFVRLYGITFLGRARCAIAEKAHEMPFFMLLGMGLEAVLVVLVGLFPAPIVLIMQSVMNGGGIALPMADLTGIIWGGSGHYAMYSPVLLLALAFLVGGLTYIFVFDSKALVRKDVTWNCGTVPTKEQQYSATGFSKPLRRAFDYLLKPRREAVYLRKEHDYFGRQLQYNLIVPDRITDKLYVPVQHYIVSSASMLRKIQQGSVRLYIGYAMAAMVIVLIWGAL